MKPLLLFALFVSTAQADELGLYAYAGKGLRNGAYNVGAGYEPIKIGNGRFGAEVEFIDAGEQPEPHPNINRFLNLNIVGRVEFSDRVTGFGKAGISSTRYSHNGTNDYEADKSLKGFTASVGLETPLSKNTMLGFQVSVMEYQQASNPNMGGYSNAVLLLRYKL
jgi:opacity protein-like surface antigen